MSWTDGNWHFIIWAGWLPMICKELNNYWYISMTASLGSLQRHRSFRTIWRELWRSFAISALWMQHIMKNRITFEWGNQEIVEKKSTQKEGPVDTAEPTLKKVEWKKQCIDAFMTSEPKLSLFQSQKRGSLSSSKGLILSTKELRRVVTIHARSCTTPASAKIRTVRTRHFRDVICTFAEQMLDKLKAGSTDGEFKIFHENHR